VAGGLSGFADTQAYTPPLRTTIGPIGAHRPEVAKYTSGPLPRVAKPASGPLLQRWMASTSWESASLGSGSRLQHLWAREGRKGAGRRRRRGEEEEEEEEGGGGGMTMHPRARRRASAAAQLEQQNGRRSNTRRALNPRWRSWTSQRCTRRKASTPSCSAGTAGSAHPTASPGQSPCRFSPA